VEIKLPSLNERREDIPLLVNHFVAKYCNEMGKPVLGVNNESMKKLVNYDWRGGVRELENIIERAMILSRSSSLSVESLKSIKGPSKEKFQSLEDYERDYIISVLDHTMWRINGTKGAATILDMHPETLRSRIRKLGIERLNTIE
jgi:DNA-binding NtrC family response regulator